MIQFDPLQGYALLSLRTAPLADCHVAASATYALCLVELRIRSMNKEADDFELVCSYAHEQSQEAFRALVERHSSFVITVCRRRLFDSHLAEDAAQKVFVILAENCVRISNRPLRPYLFKVSLGVCSEFRRKRLRRERHEEAFAALIKMARSGMNAVSDRALALNAALERIPQSYREAIELRYILGSSVPEVAASLNISIEAAKKRLTRGISQLRSLLQEGGIVPAIVTPQLFESLREVSPLGFSKRVEDAVARSSHAKGNESWSKPRKLASIPFVLAMAAAVAVVGYWIMPSMTPQSASITSHPAAPKNETSPALSPATPLTLAQKLQQPIALTTVTADKFGPLLNVMSKLSGVQIDVDWSSVEATGVSERTIINTPGDTDDLLQQLNEICDAAAPQHRVECVVQSDRLLIRGRSLPPRVPSDPHYSPPITKSER